MNPWIILSQLDLDRYGLKAILFEHAHLSTADKQTARKFWADYSPTISVRIIFVGAPVGYGASLNKYQTSLDGSSLVTFQRHITARVARTGTRIAQLLAQ